MKSTRFVTVLVIIAMVCALFPASGTMAGKQGGKQGGKKGGQRGSPAAGGSSVGISAGYPSISSPAYAYQYPRLSRYPHYPGYPRYWRSYWPGYYWGCGWGWPWYYGWGGYYPSSGYYGDYNLGKVKTKVKPKSAKVYVNGELVGLADDFDGWGENLWLRPGMYLLIFRETGYAPYVTDAFVRQRKSTDIKFKMEAGEDVLSEEVQSKLAMIAEQERNMSEEQDSVASPAADSSDRQREERTSTYFEDSGRLILTVAPMDASIYLDGNLWGSLEKTRNKLGVIRLAPGNHQIEITRPGYADRSEAVKIVKDQDFALNIVLEKEETGEPGL